MIRPTLAAALCDVNATLERVETDGRAQQFKFGYAVELLRLLANDSAEASILGPKQVPIDSLDMQARWARAEYLADVLEGHVEALTTVLDEVETLKSRIYGAA